MTEYNQHMNSIAVTRRVNLGNYESYEAKIIVFDEDESLALSRALKVINKLNVLLDRPELDISKLGLSGKSLRNQI